MTLEVLKSSVIVVKQGAGSVALGGHVFFLN